MYYIRQPYRISYDLPPINKYVNLVDIKTHDFASIDDTTKTRVCNFYKSYCIDINKSYGIDFNPAYLEGSNYPSYISIYKKPKMLFEKNSIEPAMYIDEYISTITARILHITLKGIKTIPLYYVGNLCCHSTRTNVADEMIATHLYNVSRLQRKVVTFLFRQAPTTANEIVSATSANGIVPLTTFITREYDISHFYFMPFPIGSVALIEITKKNISLFTHFINQYKNFDCIVLPEISNIQNTIHTGNMYIYGIIQNREMISAYVFKKQRNDTVVCVASSYIHGLMPDIFIIGFLQALSQIYKRDDKLKRIMIENTSHNASIVEYANANAAFINEYSSEYFLYNYGCYTYKPGECFLIC